MYKKHKLFLLLFALILISTTVSAIEGSLKLLAVAESENGFTGKIANLNLEIIKGKGRVFLDTFPLTKFDTQISTRFAKQISCDFLEVDCSGYDFIYTINSDSGIIGGPSAGAATAVLTTALLKGLKLNPKIAMTGTINSGGLIGPVSGLFKKIEAAGTNGITIVLIPRGTRYVNINEAAGEEIGDLFNKTEIDLVEFGAKNGITVVEISKLSEAMEYFTGQPFIDEQGILTINSDYLVTMKGLANKLCARSQTLKSEISSGALEASLEQNINEADELLKKSNAELKEEKYYSAASRCFAANIKYAYVKKILKAEEREDLIQQASILLNKINQSELDLKEKKLATIMDLQAYMVVKERLEEAKLLAKKVTESGSEFDYAYAIERFESAIAWSEFFGKMGRTYKLEESTLKDSCRKKISEAEERIQYVGFYIPDSLETVKEGLAKANEYALDKEYVLCLFKASKTKAEADSLYTMLNVPEDKIKEIIHAKLDIAKNSIIKESKSGSFPILAYSYYEYTQQLVDENAYSALLYSQYALELSNLQMYFNQKRNILTLVLDSDYAALTLFLGLAIGILLGYYYRSKP